MFNIYPLNPEQRARDAACQVALALTEQIQSALNKINGSEGQIALHDFRVSLRRLRTLLSKFSKAFPKNSTKPVLEELANFAKSTNQLRDLDVFLLSKKSLLQNFQGADKRQLSKLFRELDSEREKLLAETFRQVEHTATNLPLRLKDFFSSQNQRPPSPYSDKKAKKIAEKVIKKRYSKIVKLCKSISKFDDDQIHKTRIACKHFRYLLEFFANLFHFERISKIEEEMKKIQDTLGHYNDLRNQIDFLKKKILEYKGKKIVLTIKKAIEKLKDEKNDAKKKVFISLKQLSSKKFKSKLREAI